MAAHNILGQKGEEAAVNHLLQKGYVIRHRNWKRGHFELDIVAVKVGELVVVEVKTRRNINFALPQDAVTEGKIKWTVLAADAYIRFFQLDIPVRFDIITIVGQEGHFHIEHIEAAFCSPVCVY
jgi:putative endonuclease